MNRKCPGIGRTDDENYRQFLALYLMNRFNDFPPSSVVTSVAFPKLTRYRYSLIHVEHPNGMTPSESWTLYTSVGLFLYSSGSKKLVARCLHRLK